MSRRIPESKTLIVREGGGGGYIFFVLFIINFQGLEDIFGGFSLGGEVLDEEVDGCGRDDGGGGGRGSSGGFGVPDHLRAMVSFGFSQCLGGLTFIGTVSLLPAAEAESLPDASGTICRREFSEMDCVNIHGIGVFG